MDRPTGFLSQKTKKTKDGYGGTDIDNMQFCCYSCEVVKSDPTREVVQFVWF
jgi:hypothetical protein